MHYHRMPVNLEEYATRDETVERLRKKAFNFASFSAYAGFIAFLGGMTKLESGENVQSETIPFVITGAFWVASAVAMWQRSRYPQQIESDFDASLEKEMTEMVQNPSMKEIIAEPQRHDENGNPEA